jgi:hypothetical protein
LNSKGKRDNLRRIGGVEPKWTIWISAFPPFFLRISAIVFIVIWMSDTCSTKMFWLILISKYLIDPNVISGVVPIPCQLESWTFSYKNSSSWRLIFFLSLVDKEYQAVFPLTHRAIAETVVVEDHIFSHIFEPSFSDKTFRTCSFFDIVSLSDLHLRKQLVQPVYCAISVSWKTFSDRETLCQLTKKHFTQLIEFFSLMFVGIIFLSGAVCVVLPQRIF